MRRDTRLPLYTFAAAIHPSLLFLLLALALSMYPPLRDSTRDEEVCHSLDLLSLHHDLQRVRLARDGGHCSVRCVSAGTLPDMLNGSEAYLRWSSRILCAAPLQGRPLVVRTARNLSEACTPCVPDGSSRRPRSASIHPSCDTNEPVLISFRARDGPDGDEGR